MGSRESTWVEMRSMGSGEGREGAKAGNYQKDIGGFFHFLFGVNTVKSKGKSSFSLSTILYTHT